MAHSHQGHREHQVSHRRVHHILKGEPNSATRHAKSHAFSKVSSKTAAVRHEFVAGTKAPKRFARGGKVKSKGHQTNIIIAPHPAPPAGGAPGGPPMPMAGGPPLPPMGGPPGMPPGAPPRPPGMPMRKHGGRIDGESTKGDIKKWGKRTRSESYAQGGKIKAGASTGVSRLQEANKLKRK